MTQVWAEASQHQVAAGNGLLSVAFARQGKAVVLQSLVNCATGAQLLAEPREADPLWEIELRDASGNVVTVSSGDAPATWDAKVTGGAEVSLHWADVPVGASRIAVEVKVTVKPGDPITHWRLRLRSSGREWGLWSLAFPVVAGVRAEPRVSLAFPTGWGLLFRDALAAGEVRGTYPSMSPAMQFLACWQQAGGIYLGAHDPQASHKDFICRPDAESKRLRLALVNLPAGMGQPPAQYDLPYQAALGVFTGDWYNAALLYRRWAISEAPWLKRGALRSRRSTPRWLKDIDIWCLSSGGPAEVVEPARRFAAYFGVPTAVHWYNWHQIPFDDHYPEYFPTKEGFAQGVAELQAAGIRVMPYINGRLWDPRTDSWTAENAQAACAKDENLNRYEETYGSGVPLVVMCPYTDKWRTKIVSLVERLAHECGVDGVYVDQISAAGAKLCFDPGHGHPVGGGGFWVAGYRQMLQAARRRLPPGRMLTTEEDADPWVDLLDAFLLVNTPPNRGEVIPLFPAVYGGRTITFGFQYIAAEDLDRGLPFRAKMARAFCWGAQLGWVGPEILSDKYAREAEYLRNLAQCRRRAHDFLAFGQMLAPPTIRGAAQVTIEGKAPFGGDYRIELPAVIGSAWRAANGDVGIALTNMTDQEQSAMISLGAARLGLSPNLRYALTRITPAGEQPVGEVARAGRLRREVLAPRSALVLRMSPLPR